ncbi:MAG: protease inhibitor I42 family protein [Planctomycetota bacterium]|nr:protease inhibitor I42 family protein [Planctomycetota bacterium]
MAGLSLADLNTEIKPMLKRTFLAGFLLVTLVLLAACHATTTSTSPDGTVLEKQHRTLTIGQSSRVVLVSNRTTGFEWTINRSASTGMDLITIKDSGYTSTDSADGVVGAPGRQWWLIQGNKPGTAIIHLVYHRPWEKDTPPARQAVFTIDVSRSASRSRVARLNRIYCVARNCDFAPFSQNLTC